MRTEHKELKEFVEYYNRRNERIEKNRVYAAENLVQLIKMNDDGR